ncbi:hypothetical protein T07_14586 [Trichinella nelsoni]|uniref:Uncharacterized protein n=1 Tax=Trichinella nelsoni TaxID=6336 RepID=A0A0V0RQW8_9BILA|nr:hypothetical protein T07_9253 [Trichinella nelsoni]KRX16828.1 hypothetical protein T07_14586 [Trichinella nelsoni]
MANFMLQILTIQELKPFFVNGMLYFSVGGTNLDATASIRKFYRAIWQSAAQHRSKSMVARVG